MEVFPASRRPEESPITSMLERDADRRRSAEPNDSRDNPRRPNGIFHSNIDRRIRNGPLIYQEQRSEPADVHKIPANESSLTIPPELDHDGVDDGWISLAEPTFRHSASLNERTSPRAI